jgi:hypothetical protein
MSLPTQATRPSVGSLPPSDQFGPEHTWEHQAYLLREKKLARQTVTQRLGRAAVLFHSDAEKNLEHSRNTAP